MNIINEVALVNTYIIHIIFMMEDVLKKCLRKRNNGYLI